MTRPVLFLDIDGVLNSVAWFKKNKGLTKQMDPECVKLLSRVVATTHCSIVVSSTWRRIHTLEEIRDFIFDAGYAHGTLPLMGSTPYLPNQKRGAEVDMWIRTHPERMTYRTHTGEHQVRFACVDDDGDFERWHSLVKTDNDVGLTDKDADALISALLTPSL